MELYQITAKHFCAGFITRGRGDCVIKAAPILRYMIGWRINQVLAYCEHKNWKMHLVTVGSP